SGGDASSPPSPRWAGRGGWGGGGRSRTMRVLIVGGGGREHALAWKLAQSDEATQLFAAPGNPGIAELARCVPIKAEAVAELAAFAERERIDLTVVGPEAP